MQDESKNETNGMQPSKRGRGGKRAGAGRKAKETVRVEVRLAPAVAEAFRAAARNARKSLGDMVADWLKSGEM